MYIINAETKHKIRATISSLGADEFAIIAKSKRFPFNWNKEKAFNVFKITAEVKDEILGLMSVDDRPQDYVVEIRLLASSKENMSSNKKYERIAGCLIAYACKKSFQAGYDGYVCLKPKTDLITHYVSHYGFKSTHLYLVTEGKNSLMLIMKYNEDKRL